MELRLTFRQGTIRGDGRDPVGPFTLDGTYDVKDGQCWWTKRYLAKHAVSYRGFNEGKGIWGVWEIPPTGHGGFHIWPAGRGDSAPESELAAEVREPVETWGH
jgi:hypothetical protein